VFLIRKWCLKKNTFVLKSRYSYNFRTIFLTVLFQGYRRLDAFCLTNRIHICRNPPGYSRAQWYVSGSPYLKTTPPVNSLAGRRYCGTQAINKSYSTLLSLTPCLCEAWRLGCEVFTLVASGVWLSHPWVDLLGRSAIHTSPLIT
jgi:hypothetical protein